MQSKEWIKLRKMLEGLSKETDKALRAIKIATIVAKAMRSIGINPILVGGAAVSFYTNGRYSTSDIDMVAICDSEIETVMKNLGFSRFGKDYIDKKHNIYVEFPSEELGSTEKFDVIKVGEDELRIISTEDLVVDRLCAFKFWKSSVDGVNALIILETAKVDKDRLTKRAREEDVLDALDHVNHTLRDVIRKKLSPKEATKLLEKFIKVRL